MNRVSKTMLLAVFTLLIVSKVTFAEVLYKYEITLQQLKDNVTEIKGILDITNSGAEVIDTLSIQKSSDISSRSKFEWKTASMINIALPTAETVRINFNRKLEGSDIKSPFFTLSSIAPTSMRAEKNQHIIDINAPTDYTIFMTNDNYSTIRGSEVDRHIFNFNGFLESIDIIASNDYTVSYTEDAIVGLNTYFFNYQDNESTTYLELMDNYIREYSDLFSSKFPYPQFSALSVKLPIGYAMPTYTAIYDKIITQDFIKTQSLPHEILHQWFGVNIRSKGANWSEAISTYFGDHYQLDKLGKAANYRKSTLINYMRFLEKGEVYKLSEFQGNDGKLSQSIGYGKGLFFFHNLKESMGADRFYSGISNFINNFKDKEATWDDILKSFNDNKTVNPIAKFFLDNTTMVEFKDISSNITVIDGEYFIDINFKRENGQPRLTVKYFVDYYDNNSVEKIFESKLGENKLSIKVTSPIAKIYLDRSFDIFRKVTPSEIPKSFGQFRSLPDIIAIDDNGSCTDLIEEFGIKKVVKTDEIKFSSLAEANYLICGRSNLLKLLIPQNLLIEDSKVTEYKVINNPLSTKHYMMIATNPKRENINLLSRYSNLSRVYFDNAKIVEREETDAENGILLYANRRTAAYIVDRDRTVTEAIESFGDYPVVFIGESHTNFAHHLNQLDIIKSYYDKGKKIAVAFEMINKKFQPTLDNYTLGKLDERAFLKGVEYYDRWRYDHTLYSPIFKFLKENKIKGLALNIENEINRKVARGGVESLTKEERAKLPAEMSLDNVRYFTELQQIFSAHAKGETNSGAGEFANFYLAQNIWDETMAEEIYKFHVANPDTLIIVLAGGMHLNKDSGIPLRFKRLSGKDGLVIHQDTDIDSRKADIVLATDDIKFPDIKKMGVSLADDKFNGEDVLKVASIDNQSVAYFGGMREGDIIIDCDKKKISDITDIKILLANITDKNSVSCTVERKGNKININIQF